MVSPILPDHFSRTATRATPARSAPDPNAQAISEQLVRLIHSETLRREFMPFARFMELALYAPGLGYYSNGTRKLGAGGDFVTAPEMSPLFGRTLARLVFDVLGETRGAILELGAGSGRLAIDILSELRKRDCLPSRYFILEVSAPLRERQFEALARELPDLLDRVEWLDSLPDAFKGVIIGNEVLDALPVELVETDAGVIYQRGIETDSATQTLRIARRPAEGQLLAQACNLRLPDRYITEIHLSAQALVRSLAGTLRQGMMIFIDYGFPRHEYYHPERTDGTLMCHYQQQAHQNPLGLIGLQDITSHIDFSAIADAAVEGGLKVHGYTQQARFLIDCGILDLLGEIDPGDAVRYAPAAAAVQRLLSPSEMGELFKVIALGRDIANAPCGFRTGDRRHTL